MTDIAQLGIEIRTDGAARAERDLDRLDDAGGRVERTFSKTQKAVAAAFAVIASMGTAIHVISEFETSISKLGAVSRATATELQAMRNVARDLGATTEFSAGQAADGLTFLAMAGFSASEAIAAIPATLDLATASGLDLASSADIASNVMSGFGIAAENAAAVADVLAAASSRANTDVYQLGEAMKFVGPVAAALDVSMSDAAAAIGVLSDAGIQGGMAGTSLRRILSSLISPTGEAAKAIADLGLSVDDLNPKTNSLTSIVNRLADAGLDAGQAMTIAGERGGPALLALTAQASNLNVLTDSLTNVGGEAARMANTMRDNLGGDIETLKSTVSGLILSLGDAGLTAILRGVIQVATTVISVFTHVTNIVGGLIGAVVGVGRELLGFGATAVQTQQAIDNISLAIGDEVRALGVLSGVLRPGTQLSRDAATAKLQETQAIYAKIEAARQEALQETMRSEAYRQSQQEIDRVRQELERIVRFQQDAADDPNSMLNQMPEAAQRAKEQIAGIQDALVAAVERQNALVAAAAPLGNEFSNAKAHIDLLQKALTTTDGEVVTLGGNVDNAITLTDRLSLAANGVSFSGAAAEAQNLAEWLGISVSRALALANTTPAMADEDAAMAVGVVPDGAQREANRRAVANINRLIAAQNTSTPSGRPSGGSSRSASAARAAREATEELTEAEKAAKKYAETMDGIVVEGIESFEAAVKEGLNGSFDSFKDFGKAVKETLKNTLIELAYMAAKNKIMIGLGLGGGGGLASVANAATGGIVGGGGGILGAISGAGGLAGLGSAFMGGMSFLGSGIASGFAAGGIGGAISGGVSALGTALSGATLGIGGAAAALGAAVPVIGAVYAIGKIFGIFGKKKKKPIIKSEDFNRIIKGLSITGQTLTKTGSAATDLTARMKGLHKVIGGSRATKAEQWHAKDLMKLAGGSKKFLEKSEGFFDLFYSGTEKLKMAQDAVAASFEKINMAVPQSKKEFRSLLEGLDLTTAAGRKAYVAMLDIAPIFAEIAGQASQTSQAIAALVGNQGVFTSLQEAVFAASSTGYTTSLSDEKELLRQQNALLSEIVRATREGDINTARILSSQLSETQRQTLNPETES